MTKTDAVQVNLIYLIFNLSNFLLDTNDKLNQKNVFFSINLVFLNTIHEYSTTLNCYFKDVY